MNLKETYSLYVHWPWCVRRCPYCDFNAHQKPDVMPEKAYVEALKRDFQSHQADIKGRVLKSIFLGGGTPSLFSSESIAEVLHFIQTEVACSPDIEITMEVNPGTHDSRRFAGFVRAGVNRFSIGVQSFQNQALQALGRIHDAKAAMEAVKTLQSLGIENINIDLMHSLPGQTVQMALSDLKQAHALGVPHISWYELTLEPNTVFYSKPPVLPEEPVLEAIQETGQAYLKDMGFEQYEVSAYAKEGMESQHNLNYWVFGDYIGIGAGAHSKWSFHDTGALKRSAKTRKPEDYLKRMAENPAVFWTDVSSSQQVFEFMLNYLRLYRPLTFSFFESVTGLLRTVLQLPLTIAEAKGWIEYKPDGFQLSVVGHRFLNDVTALFLPEEG